MADNPYVNKVVYGDQTIIDISDTTATEADVVAGKTLHTADGALRTGTAQIPTKTSDLTNDSGFITGMTILSYGSSTWNDFITAYNANKVVYCRASSNSNPASGSQTRLAFMAYVDNASTPTNVEFQYYRSVNSHSNSQQGDQVYVYKLTNAGTWTVTVRESYTKIVAGTGLSSSYSSGVLTITNTKTTAADVGALPSTGGTVSGDTTFQEDVTIGGMLDVTSRRCEASLGGAGWYRAIIYNAYNESSAKGSSGEIVHIRIINTGTTNTQHEITLVLTANTATFINEMSVGTNEVICDRIRYSYAGSVGCVDIHIGHSTSLTYNVSFDVATRNYAIPNWTAGTLASVADSPTGETVLASHKFTTNTGYQTLSLTRTNNSYYNATDFGRIYGYAKNDNIYINLNLRTSAALPANTSSFEIGKITLPPNRRLMDTVFQMIPTQDATSAVLFMIETDGKMKIANYTATQIGASVFHRAQITAGLIPTT